jgi:hypothetical protein
MASSVLEYFFGKLSPEKQRALEEIETADRGAVNMNMPNLPEIKRAESVVASSIPRILTAPGEMAGMVQQIQNAFDRPDIDKEGKPVSFINRLGQAKYGETGYEDFVKGIGEEIARRQAAGDTRSEDQIADEFTKSREFEGFQRRYMPTIAGASDAAANFIDRAVGAPIDSEKNLPERIATVYCISSSNGASVWT